MGLPQKPLIILYICGFVAFLLFGVKPGIPIYQFEREVCQKDTQKAIYQFDQRKVNVGILTDKEQLELEFVRYVTSVAVGCSKRERLGHIRDGGWDVCMSGPFALKSPCLVYSFGIADDWSFDDAVSRKYNCTVRAFDPSINTKNHTRRVNGSVVHFYNVGLNGSDTQEIRGNETWMMRTFSTLYKALDPPQGSNAIQPAVDYLKLDVEGSEIDAVSAMFSDGILHKVKQVGLEIHTGNTGFNLKMYVEQWKILEMLEASGFRKWHFHINRGSWTKFHNGVARASSYELIYINTNFLNYDKDVTKINFEPINDII